MCGPGGALTKVLLLELAGQVTLDEGGLAWGGGVDVGGAGQDVDLRRGAASRAWRSAIWEERGTRPLRRPRRGMGVALTGTTVTDEDELESGSLSHLSSFCLERDGRGSA